MQLLFVTANSAEDRGLQREPESAGPAGAEAQPLQSHPENHSIQPLVASSRQLSVMLTSPAAATLLNNPRTNQ